MSWFRTVDPERCLRISFRFSEPEHEILSSKG
jgi:hypothetical protein